MTHGPEHRPRVGPVATEGPGTKPDTDHLVSNHEEHPGERTYVVVAIVLAIVTAIEVAIYYVEALEDLLVPLLIVLSLAKFVAVVGYFMHLKFDDKRFTWMFASALVVGVATFIAVLVMFAFERFAML